MNPDGLKIALERIAREAKEKTGFLDLRMLGLTEFPDELFALRHLRRLILGRDYYGEGKYPESSSAGQSNRVAGRIARLTPLRDLQGLFLDQTDFTDLSELANLPNLHTLDCSFTEVSDLAPLKGARNLHTLDCARTLVSDLTPLKGAPNLHTLNCSNTKVSDLTPLKDVPNLQKLYCIRAWVTDLRPLKDVPNLQTLDCSMTHVSDLTPLKDARNLQELHCAETNVSDLGPLRGCPSLHTLRCPYTPVSDLTPLEDAPNLQTLHCSETQVSDLGPLKNAANLQTLWCTQTQVSDLTPLKNASNLRKLQCSQTQVSNLLPLKDAPNLQELDCSVTSVSDLSPLKGAPNLQKLNCSGTEVSDLGPLKDVPNLHTLACSHTEVSDLAPLKDAPNLRVLNCSATSISDLSPLKDAPNLRELNCSTTSVSDLSPLKDAPNLRELNCSATSVSDLSPLKDVSNLQVLDCSQTQVSDIGPLVRADQLAVLKASGCRLTTPPDGFWGKPSLAALTLWQTSIPGIPTEVLSQSRYDNCLSSLRAHLDDLAAGAQPVPDVKLMVLGNGRVGKTQICRRLRGMPYDKSVKSTHGIIVTTAPLPRKDGEDTARLNIWDFGGQDIYHGTHALFMRSRAIFALVWFPGAEKEPLHEHGGFMFRNQPLAYWLQYVKSFGGTDSPVLVVQTRCDAPEDEELLHRAIHETLGAFAFRKVLHYSAQNNRGRPALDDALAQAAAWLYEKGGIAVIGAGRAKVKRAIEDMRDADAARSRLERRDRVLSFERFQAMCDETKGISDPKRFLAYLHNTGTVFYREGLFEDRIIIDQGWALEAIYAVFNRDQSYRRILRQNGRFTRSDLAEWIWDEAGHGVKEQELFISMMQSCGICFRHRPASRDGLVETEYIAPDLLPEKPERDAAQMWDTDHPTERAERDFPLLPTSLMRGILARIGSEAGLAADYWRSGVSVYEATTNSRGLIEQTTTGGWQGKITVQTQRGQAGLLLHRLVQLIEEEERRIGVAPAAKDATSARAPEDPDRAPEDAKAAPALQFARERGTQPEYFISYAWGDDTPAGKRREEVVDRLCAAAEEKEITILRDKKALGLGDRISKFMIRLGAGDRIFVVLSDKYLKSPYCMYELTEVWRNCLQDEEKFLDRARIITLPDAKVSTPYERGLWGKHWREQREKLKEVFDDLGKKDLEQFWLMKNFAHLVGDILAAVADIVQPRSDEEFAKYGLGDLLGLKDDGKQ